MLTGARRDGWVALLAAAVSSFALSGCGVAPSSVGSSGMVMGQAIRGTVYGGQQPVSNAQVQLLTPGTSGYGSASVSLLKTPVSTDANGDFNISGDYPCTVPGEPVYMVISGGNPGLAAGTNNAAITMLAYLGSCGELMQTSYVSVNELTTVAAVYALQAFFAGPTSIGAPQSNQLGITNAFATISSLVTVSGYAPGNPPSIATLPLAELNTLADALAPCINSDGSTAGGTACGRLFAAATPPSGIIPTDTASAIANIARNPGRNVTAVFDAVGATAPYQPTLTAAPSDWTLGINYNAPAFYTPSDMAIDSQGTVWVVSSPGTANAGSSTLSALTLSGLNGVYPQVTMSLGNMAIDPYNNIWLTNTNLSNVIELTGSGTRTSFTAFTGGGIQGPGPIAFDPAGNAWVVNNTATVSELSPSGVAMSPKTGYSTGGAHGPVALAVDAQGNVWTADSTGNTVAKMSNAGQIVSGGPFTGSGLSSPFSIAFDGSGEALVANRTGASVTKFAASGAPPASSNYGGAGLAQPISLIVDGLGTMWVANGGANTVSELPVVPNATASQSGLIGYGSAFLSNPYKVAVDGSGNVWVMNVGTTVAGSGTITQLVGAANPVITPLSVAVKTNTIGQRP